MIILVYTTTELQICRSGVVRTRPRSGFLVLTGVDVTSVLYTAMTEGRWALEPHEDVYRATRRPGVPGLSGIRTSA